MVINRIGHGLLKIEWLFKALNGFKNRIQLLIREILPDSLKLKFDVRTLTRFHRAVAVVMGEESQAPYISYDYGYGKIYGPKSSVKEIQLPRAHRSMLLELVEAARGGRLTARDRFRTDIEIVRCVWRFFGIGGLAWDYGVLLRPNEGGWKEDIEFFEYWRNLVKDDLKRYADALKKGALVAFLDANLAVWEACQAEKEWQYIEKDITCFMACWNRLARVLDIRDPNLALHEKRITALVECSRLARPAGMSAWDIYSPN